ncbi:MAG: hypothetical protein CM1200mP26_01680 [Acidimicrobiales bacterium]|nr:MAG: hypothetical protein CM1200mP26_01680 [Acidimicrobiales bacterium]
MADETIWPVSPALWTTTVTSVSAVKASRVPSEIENESWVTSVIVWPATGSDPPVGALPERPPLSIPSAPQAANAYMATKSGSALVRVLRIEAPSAGITRFRSFRVDSTSGRTGDRRCPLSPESGPSSPVGCRNGG